MARKKEGRKENKNRNLKFLLTTSSPIHISCNPKEFAKHNMIALTMLPYLA